jgi:hypothetical protein
MAKKEDIKPEKSEGFIYVSSDGGSFNVPKRLTIKDIKDMEENPYFNSIWEKLSALIFPGKVKISAEDSKGEINQELTAHIKEIAKRTNLNGKIKSTARDRFKWGCSIVSPGYDWIEGWYDLINLNLLPPDSFSNEGDDDYILVSRLLPGIGYTRQKKITFYQTTDTGQYKIKNAVMIKDPTDPYLSGRPSFAALYGVLKMLDYCFNTQMQKVHRTGAPFMFIKIDTSHPDAQASDTQYAKLILKNWGKDVGFALRPNFEVVVPDFKDTKDNLDTIDVLHKIIIDYFSPGAFISKDGQLIGGSDAYSFKLLKSYIESWQSWLEDAYEQIFQKVLDDNGYKDYSVKIDIPEIQENRTEDKRKAVETACNCGISITQDEARSGLEALDLNPLGDEDGSELVKKSSPPQMEFTGASKYDKPIDDIEKTTEDQLSKISDDFEKTIMKILEIE